MINWMLIAFLVFQHSYSKLLLTGILVNWDIIGFNIAAEIRPHDSQLPATLDDWLFCQFNNVLIYYGQ